MTHSAQELAPLDQAQPGTVLRRSSIRLSRDDLVAYAGASGDHNPIHQDEAVARSVGLPDVIAHGMLTMGLVGSEVEQVADGRNILSFGTRFAAPVVVPEDGGAELVIELRLQAHDAVAKTATVEAAATVAGIKVLSRTRAVIQLD